MRKSSREKYQCGCTLSPLDFAFPDRRREVQGDQSNESCERVRFTWLWRADCRALCIPSSLEGQGPSEAPTSTLDGQIDDLFNGFGAKGTPIDECLGGLDKPLSPGTSLTG